MMSLRTWRAILCLSCPLLALWIGCASTPSKVSDPSAELFPPGEMLVAPGTPDLENIHLPSVMVSASIVTERGRLARKSCSGVIVHPRLVFTAGHCVCAARTTKAEDRLTHFTGMEPTGPTRADRVVKHVVSRGSALEDVSLTSIIDAKSPCAETVTVTTVRYLSTPTGSSSRPEIRDHVGEVVIHPALEMISGRRGQAQGVVWSHADLAAIFLKEPLEDTLPRLSLTETEVRVGQAVTMVGYGTGNDASPSFGVRHFGNNRVTQLIYLETGSTAFRTEEQQLLDGEVASHAQGGDSGGACVRSSNKHELIGITSIGAQKPTGERMSIFTSVYSHRGWLLQMIKQADKS
ncbi:trypsin-like serine protease [Hyalangium versicolor]|uniref:trypsin-like serine protease n=1 Tax=Hyalangium versicolor TaxID=2861190 RepID=UPI001CD034E7|nr:trypsin-like serine protease [Hyalangium versicolor]